eukprot:3649770-Pyramimonas_sp.AAC.1
MKTDAGLRDTCCTIVINEGSSDSPSLLSIRSSRLPASNASGSSLFWDMTGTGDAKHDETADSGATGNRNQL